MENERGSFFPSTDLHKQPLPLTVLIGYYKLGLNSSSLPLSCAHTYAHGGGDEERLLVIREEFLLQRLGTNGEHWLVFSSAPALAHALTYRVTSVALIRSEGWNYLHHSDRGRWSQRRAGMP